MIYFRRKKREEEPVELKGTDLSNYSLQNETQSNVVESTHQRAREYKDLCRQANDMVKKDNSADAGNGWTKVDSSGPSKSNFKAVLYEKDGQYALCHVGTDKFSLKNIKGFAKDWGANLKMGITGNSKQIVEANDFADTMKTKYGLTPENTVSIGHSEGGTEATHVGLNNGLKTYTFNGYGVHKNKLPEGVDTNLVINYRDPSDPVSKLHANVGQTYIVPNFQGNKEQKSINPLGSVKYHSIDNMGDVQKAVPVEKYKEKHSNFINKLSEAEITGEDIGLMDSKTFAFYEPEIDERLRRRQIFPSAFLAERGVPYIAGINGARGYYRRFV